MPVHRFLAALLLLLSAPASAQEEAGDIVVLSGYVYLHPLEQSGDIVTRVRESLASNVLGIPEEFRSPGTSLSAEDSDTLGLSVAYYFAPGWAIELDAGNPPVVNVSGQGVVRPPGPSGVLFNLDLGDPAINPVGTARQWSPALVLHWQPLTGDWWIQPFVGVGAAYVWFSDVRPSPEFAAALDRRFGSVLATAAGKPGPTTAHADIDPSWALVLNGGVSIPIGPRWSLNAAAAFVQFNSSTRVDVLADDGTLLSRTTSDVDVQALVLGLLVGYRF
ncbi:MAG TPA: OmpW family outer membrane protein [Nevskiaceae bacterium]|nr:OmpW family outer membrane protein [Nevskiaceae bacterium]